MRSPGFNNTFILPRLAGKVNEKTYGLSSMLALAGFYVGMFFVPSLWLIFPLNMLASGMNSFIFPSLTTLSAERVENHEIGSMLGVTSAVGSLMNVLGPLWAGMVYDHVMVGAPYWMGAIILVLGAVLFSRVKPARSTLAVALTARPAELPLPVR